MKQKLEQDLNDSVPSKRIIPNSGQFIAIINEKKAQDLVKKDIIFSNNQWSFVNDVVNHGSVILVRCKSKDSEFSIFYQKNHIVKVKV